MKKQKVLVIGNKPYQKLSLDKLIDSFCNNVRCNLSLPGLNNGSIVDELAMCNYIYHYFVKEPASKEQIVKRYGDVYDIKYIEENFSRYKEILSKYNRVYYASEDASRHNSLLRSLGCPHLVETIPRTGLTVIIENLLKDHKVFVTNFSIKKEIRYSHYITKNYVEKQFRSEKNKKKGLPEEIPTCHNTDNEIKILRWLHQNEKIDASLCLLEDKKDPSLNLNGLEPSDYIFDLIQQTYGKSCEKK